jgi:hypothetical protein
VRRESIYPVVCVAGWYCFCISATSPSSGSLKRSADSGIVFKVTSDLNPDFKMVMLCGSEENLDLGASSVTSRTPRQSSRLAEKLERRAKRKLDTGDEENMIIGKLKGRRKSADPDTCTKRRNSLSPKVKDQKAAVSSPPITDISDSCSKTEPNQQSDKYCHFCQVLSDTVDAQLSPQFSLTERPYSTRR